MYCCPASFVIDGNVYIETLAGKARQLHSIHDKLTNTLGKTHRSRGLYQASIPHIDRGLDHVKFRGMVGLTTVDQGIL
jgi:hypothetical protein